MSLQCYHKEKVDAGHSYGLPLHTLMSVCKFSTLFFIHFLRCWQGEFVYQSKDSFPGDQFLYSHDLDVWFRGNVVGRNKMLITPKVLKVKGWKWHLYWILKSTGNPTRTSHFILFSISQHLIFKVEKQVIQTPIFKYATSLFLDQQLSPLFQVVKAKLLPFENCSSPLYFKPEVSSLQTFIPKVICAYGGERHCKYQSSFIFRKF